VACFYTGSAEGDAQLAHNETRERLGKTITELTEMLCNVCQEMDKEYENQIDAANRPISFLNCSPEVRKWWKEHKKKDKERKKREKAEGAKAKRLAEKKLRKFMTEEELELLGINTK